MNLTYAKFRKAIAVLLKNQVLRERLSGLAGGQVELSEIGILDLLAESEADVELLRVLTDKSPEDVTPEEAAEAFSAFFSAAEGSWARLKPLLDGLGYKVEEAGKTA